MDKAFDAVLKTEVDAVDIAKNSYRNLDDYFRYQCLCCGEEVYLAAANSFQKAPHFKHRMGNNDTECERYLRRPGALRHFISLRKQGQVHLAFYFNRERETFEIGVSFSEEELQNYKLCNSLMTISINNYTKPFFSVPINKESFVSRHSHLDFCTYEFGDY